MRMPDMIITNRMNTNINRNLANMDNYYMQMSTFKKIQTPSENPIIASRALKYRTIVSETEQYKSNVQQARSWMEISESSYKNMNSILQKMGELCVQGASDSYTTDDRKKMYDEFSSLVEQFNTELNTTYMGRYVFSGYKTDQPVILEDGTLNPEIYDDLTMPNQDINLEIGVNNYMNINNIAPNFFDQDMYEGLHSFDSIINYINSPTFDNLPKDQKAAKEEELRKNFSTMIGTLQDYSAKIAESHTDMGVRMNRLDLIAGRLDEDKTNYTSLMSKNEDVNLSEATMYYSIAQMTYNAALKVGMSITKLTLADYI